MRHSNRINHTSRREAVNGNDDGYGWRRKLRVALYSHDTMGIGHMRRNQLIAQAFARITPAPNILMICGAREACCFDLPPGVDCVTLPALGKRLTDGMYHPRRLDVALDELIRLRSEILRTTLAQYEPDVLIVDKVPRGALGELDASLALLKARGSTRLVLGLRDVLDDPRIVAHEWARENGEQAVRECYDAVWVYGSREVYDVADRYGFAPDVAVKLRYTGYLQRYGAGDIKGAPDSTACPCEADPLTGSASPDATLPLPGGRILLCMVGGGQDGGHVAEAFAEAPLPPKATGVIVTGPFMPADAQRRLRSLARHRRNLRVIEFVAEIEPLLRRAERVVSMGGYNTVCEVLSMRKTALIVPRTRPRREQFIRAQHMHARGLLDYLEPERLSPRLLGEWLGREVAPVPPELYQRIDFNGVQSLPRMLGELFAAPNGLRFSTRPAGGAIEHVA